MSWLRFVPHPLKIPVLYLLQFVASAETPTGLDAIAPCKPVHPFVDWTDAILNDPPSVLHVPVFAVYG